MVLGILSLEFIIYGCGRQVQVAEEGPKERPVVDYTIQGKVARVGVGRGSVKSADVSTVTHIVAIGANNEKYLATLNSDGTFSVGISKGWPYVLGFYNKSGGQITLLGYLKQNDVNWDSLPVIEPTGSSTDLGSVEINTGSIEATPSIVLNDLISQMNMDLSTAQYYGQVDDTLSILTNVDIDGNGEFDFQENKAYILDINLGMGPGTSPVPGEISKMLSGYNDTYKPIPAFYNFMFEAKEGEDGKDQPAPGTTATLKLPQSVTNIPGVSFNTANALTESQANAWMVNYSGATGANVVIVTPEVVPSGTYTIEVSGRANYTFKNVQGSSLVALGTTEGIVYPVFNLVTNGAGYITRVNYKWKIVRGGTIQDATQGEVKAFVIDSTPGENVFVSTSPTINFFTGDPWYESTLPPRKIDLSAGYVDVLDLNVKLSELRVFSSSYNLTSRIKCIFYFQ